MDIKLTAAVAADGFNVAEFCRDQGIGRTTFYKWRRRFREEGLAGLEERSRRPKSHAGSRMDPVVEDRVVALRKQLSEDGHDAGPATIRWHLDGEGVVPLPSEAGVWRALRRRGQIVDQPAKRPRSSWRRFQFDRPNECWQIDATDWMLPTGTIVAIIDIVDDRSRVAHSRAVPAATTQAAWAVFVEAGQRWGLPGMVLSDNGLTFSGRRRNRSVRFEENVRMLGIRTITARPYHPQTCGKVERYHQTLKRWLAVQEPARTLAELNAQLDVFCAYYNHERPHQALDGATPADIHGTLAHAGPAHRPVTTPPRVTTARVCVDGTVWSRPWRIGLGKRLAGRTVTVIIDRDHGLVFDHDRLIANVTLDPSQPVQRPV